jgi:hypothetical protein
MCATNHEESQRSRLSTLTSAVKNTQYTQFILTGHFSKEDEVRIGVGRDDSDITAVGGHSCLWEAGKKVRKLIYPFDHSIGRRRAVQTDVSVNVLKLPQRQRRKANPHQR